MNHTTRLRRPPQCPHRSATSSTSPSPNPDSLASPTGCTIPLPSGPRDIYDLMGKDAVVFHHSAHSAHPADAPYVEQARSWFTAMWDNLSYEFPA